MSLETWLVPRRDQPTTLDPQLPDHPSSPSEFLPLLAFWINVNRSAGKRVISSLIINSRNATTTRKHLVPANLPHVLVVEVKRVFTKPRGDTAIVGFHNTSGGCDGFA